MTWWGNSSVYYTSADHESVKSLWIILQILNIHTINQCVHYVLTDVRVLRWSRRLPSVNILSSIRHSFRAECQKNFQNSCVGTSDSPLLESGTEFIPSHVILILKTTLIELWGNLWTHGKRHQRSYHRRVLAKDCTVSFDIEILPMRIS